MNKDDFFEMAGGPRFLSGIYNYCDRWCERCPFTSRCMVYAVEQEDDEDPATKDIKNEVFWRKLHSILELAVEERRSRVAESGGHELSQAAHKHAGMVNKCFESEQSTLEQKQKHLDTRLKLGLASDEPLVEAASLADSVEVIRWYQYQIDVKLRRALSRDEAEEEIRGDVVQTDSNGSAKVALIGI